MVLTENSITNIPEIPKEKEFYLEKKTSYISGERGLKIGNQEESVDLIVLEKANVVTDNSIGKNVVISHVVDKLSGGVVADSADDLFSSGEGIGKDDNTLSFEGNIDNYNSETVIIFRTETEE